MIWWGYSGFSAAVVASIAMLASVVGLSAEIVLGLIAYSAAGLLGLGLAVHFCIFVLRSGVSSARRAVTAPRIEPAFLRPATAVASAKPVAAPPKGKIAGLPGAVGALFPQEALR